MTTAKVGALPVTFDPASYLMKVGGKDYLEVKWRLVWLRQEHPEASIETEVVAADDKGVTVRARVTFSEHLSIGDGRVVTHEVSGTGHAREAWENKSRRGGAMENAETSALGRALAHVGYGTQFAAEMAEDTSRLAGLSDSPVANAQNRSEGAKKSQTSKQPTGGDNGAGRAGSVRPEQPEPRRVNGSDPATPEMVATLLEHYEAARLTIDDLYGWMQARIGENPTGRSEAWAETLPEALGQLTIAQAKALWNVIADRLPASPAAAS